MSTTATMGELASGPPPHDAEVEPGVLRKVLTASFIGNFVEWFDYASYGYFATVIAHAFFPEIAPTAALMATFAVFAISFAGTVLPTMVFVYCILTPRYLRLTGSLAATVVLGGLTYAMLHVLDGWTSLASPTDALLSALYVLLFYSAPGMFKTFVTLRTGNAWVHVWAYHAIAPHTLIDTPMFVKIFAIR